MADTLPHCDPLNVYVRFRFEQKLSDFLSWIRTWKSSAQALATADPRSAAEAPDLEAQLKVNLLALNCPWCWNLCVSAITHHVFALPSRQGLESELRAKEAAVSQVIQEGRGLMDQLERGMNDASTH